MSALLLALVLTVVAVTAWAVWNQLEDRNARREMAQLRRILHAVDRERGGRQP